MGNIVDPSEVFAKLGITAPNDLEKTIVQMAITSAEGAVIRFLCYDPSLAVRTEYYPQTDFTLQGRAAVWETDDNQAYVRRLSESAVDELQLKHLPIRDTVPIKVYIDHDGRAGSRNGAFAESTLKEEGVDFWVSYTAVDKSGNRFSEDGILRSLGRWPNTAGSVKVVYAAGYQAAELRGDDPLVNAVPIWEACLEEARRRVIKDFQLHKKRVAGITGPLSSENLGKYSYSQDGALLGKIVGSADLLYDTIDKLEPFVNKGWMLAS